MFMNIRNYTSKKPPVLRNIVNCRLFPYSGSLTQSLITKKIETIKILYSIIIEKNYKNFYIFESEL
jgi:hypothetical protein